METIYMKCILFSGIAESGSSQLLTLMIDIPGDLVWGGGEGWLGEARMSCILHHQGVQLILAYSWARPAVLAAGMGRWGMFLFLLCLHFHSFPLSPLSLSFNSCTISSISLLLFSGRWHTKWPTRVDVSLNPNTVNQCEICHACSKPATWKGGPLMWILPQYLQVNQKFDDDDDDDDGKNTCKKNITNL